MLKRVLKSFVISALLVSTAVAISNYAQAQSSGTGGGSSKGSSYGSSSTTEPGTGGGADAGHKKKDAGH
jgi:hypothetical protein